MPFRHFFQSLYEKIAKTAFFHIISWKNAILAFFHFFYELISAAQRQYLKSLITPSLLYLLISFL
jgi:hypothetical protein